MPVRMGAQDQVIEIQDLRRSFRKHRSLVEVFRHPLTRPDRVHALRGADLEVHAGELVGLLGPNGAGKTTLLKILCGLVLPESGRALVLGIDVRRERRVKPLIGLVQSDERSFYWRLTGRENLRFFGRLQGLRGAALHRRVDELLSQVELTENADRRFGDYSSGMKQRAALARALLRDPPILLMDEPTRALDPVAAGKIREFIRGDLMAAGRRTVLLATHNLREAEVLCHRVAILVEGRVRQVGRPGELRRWGLQGRNYRILVEGLPGDPPEGLVSRELPAGAASRPGRWFEGVLNPDEPAEVLLEKVRRAGGTVLECAPVEQDLEEVFGRIVSEDEETRR
jgi:ABC-2 type transport system ATP-binding protein